jgi:hypothetical protein
MFGWINWRTVVSTFIGRILAALFIAICIALGFGPNKWAVFLISGMPVLITPGVVRLVFLLFASATLAALLWEKIFTPGSPLRRAASIAIICLPFVVGAFYITAVPQPDRELSQKEADRLIHVFTPIANEFPNGIQVEAVSASPDAAGYAAQFMMVFRASGIKVNGIAPNDHRSAVFPTSAQVYSSKMRGLYIGTTPGEPIPQRVLKFQATLADAGFRSSITPWSGVGPDDLVFVVSYR